MVSIEQACFWLAGMPQREIKRLTEATTADVVVIGGGLTGFWAALFLKELDPSRDVALIEQGVAAYGASGRNAGMLSETVDHSHSLAIQHFGAEEAARLARLGQTNVDELLAFVQERGIACDYEPSGRLMVALTPGHVEEAKRTMEVAQSLGIETFKLLNREQIQAEVH
jgi:glycine/D-amino acid oxidase-like deaminating enzyme